MFLLQNVLTLSGINQVSSGQTAPLNEIYTPFGFWSFLGFKCTSGMGAPVFHMLCVIISSNIFGAFWGPDRWIYVSGYSSSWLPWDVGRLGRGKVKEPMEAGLGPFPHGPSNFSHPIPAPAPPQTAETSGRRLKSLSRMASWESCKNSKRLLARKWKA